MEQEIPFKIFPLPRLSSSHVSAVKPHMIVENTPFFQNLKSPLGTENAQDFIHGSQDCFAHKVTPLPIIEEENIESVRDLYTKLQREAEKIKKWKSVIEFEMKEKEAQLKDKRKTSESQRKIIKELQIENEKLRIQLEDIINENEDLINQSNATRHVCNLLKDTCDRAAEKANIYNSEIDETRQIYADLNNNIERMIMAFEELRVQAETSREEIYSQIKYEAEKMQEMQKQHSLQLATNKNQILELTKETEHFNSKLQEVNLQLSESRNRVRELEEAAKNYHLESEDYQKKIEELRQQLEETTMLLQNTKDTLNKKENHLHNAEAMLTEANNEKEIRREEFEKVQVHHALQLSEHQSKIERLKEMLISAEAKIEEEDGKLTNATMEVQRKSDQLEELAKANDNSKEEITQLRCELTECLKVQRDLENQLFNEKSENQILSKKEQELTASLDNLQVQVQNVVTENTDLKKLVGDLQEVCNQFSDTLTGKDKEIDALKMETSARAVDINNLSRQIEEIQTDINRKELKYTELQIAYEKLSKEKEVAMQFDLKANKQNVETMKKTEKVEQANSQLRKENEALKEKLKEKDKQYNECEDKKRNQESELSKKEKQRKALENKLCTLKKQVENKIKAIEELQEENKSLKKEMKEGSKPCSDLEAEVNRLHVQTENTRMEYESMISSKEMEVSHARAQEEALRAEVEKLQLASEETLMLQKETDVKCKHKIAEMMALMEKHKLQYDKTIEEKDIELCQLRAKEQEAIYSKALLEKELSKKNNEMLKLSAQLQQEMEEKEKIIQEKMHSKLNIMHKEVQTVFTETPKQSIKLGKIQTSLSYSKRTMQSDLLSQGEPYRKHNHKDSSPWTSKSYRDTGPKTYSIKTPPVMQKLHEQLNASQENLSKKKRKVALQFEFHSDSPDQTDILGLSKSDGIFKTIHEISQNSRAAVTATPKKHLAELLEIPNFASKVLKKKTTGEDTWAAISKVDRRRKMKAAEKMFN